MNSRQPRLLVVYPSCNIDVNPTMAYLLESLAERGTPVDVLLEEPSDFSPPASFGSTVRTLYRPTGHISLPGTSVRGIPRRLAGKFVRPSLYRSYRVRNDLSLLPYWSARNYSAIMGVDPVGIATANRLARVYKRPLVYLSFELMFNDELVSSDERALRQAERQAMENTVLALIQDEERAELLEREVGLPRERMSLVPVAPPPGQVPRTDFLRKRFGISADRRIVFYFGSVGAWTSRDELPEMVADWNERYCLVVHSSSRIAVRQSPEIRELVRQGRIFFSTEPVGRAELTEMVASADFGLAPYRAVADAWQFGGNVHHMGLSSAKVAYYTMCGLPVLARALPVYDREFRRYDCGRTYRRAHQSGPLLEELDRNYEHHSRESRRFYAERLSPVRPMAEFCDRLLALVREPEREARSLAPAFTLRPTVAERRRLYCGFRSTSPTFREMKRPTCWMRCARDGSRGADAT